jgi:thymidylate synthase (FAD)
MQVDYIDHMGTDLTVVNAARVSFDKESRWVEKPDTYVGEPVSRDLEDSDKKLIKYLAKHNHWTPFGHCQVTFRIKAPIFVARQLGKHQVGMVWNEVSRRYVDSEPTFYRPDEWRKRAKNIKQGSSDEVIEYSAEPLYTYAHECYSNMLADGICPEQARMVLPQSMYTEWYWTGSLAAWARMCSLRLDFHTQRETQLIAQLIYVEMNDLYPFSWKYLLDYIE